jgi:hypothetical protein
MTTPIAQEAMNLSLGLIRHAASLKEHLQKEIKHAGAAAIEAAEAIVFLGADCSRVDRRLHGACVGCFN